jgi:hypothetical protein
VNPKSIFPPGWRLSARRLTFLAGALAISAIAGLAAAQSEGTAPTITFSFYLAEDSEARLYYSDSFGNLIPQSFVSEEVVAGINNLSFPLPQGSLGASSLYRFDPCECATAIIVQRVSISSGIFFDRIPFAEWGIAGDISQVRPEGSSLFVEGSRLGVDPQILLYPDVMAFMDTARAFLFWWVFGSSLAGIATFTAVFLLADRSRKSRGESPDQQASRGRHFMLSPQVPRFLVAISMVTLLASSAQMILGAFRTGLTIDEPNHVQNVENFLSGGGYSSGVYGPFTALLGHAANVLLGIETWSNPTDGATAYAIRHLVVALIGVLGTVAVGLIAWLLFGSIRWALLGGAVVSSIPMWVGHSMFNLKDVPVATGYTLFTLGLVLFWSPRFLGYQKYLLGTVAILIGMVIGLGTRPGLWPLMAVSAAVALTLGVFRIRRVTLDKSRLGLLVVSFVALAAGAYLFFRFSDLGMFLYTAAARSVSYPWTGFNLYAGERVSQNPGLGNVLMVFGAYLPILVTVLIGAGVITGIALMVRWLRSPASPSPQGAGFLLVAVQAFAPLVIVGILDPVLYDGARQLLFIFPALAVIVVYGVVGLFSALSWRAQSARRGRQLVGALLGAGMLVIGLDQLQLFPYNYSYYNALAQREGVMGRWETDYWNASMKEASQGVFAEDVAFCLVTGNAQYNLGSQPEPCAQLAPYVGEYAMGTSRVLAEREFWAVRLERDLAEWGPIYSGNCTFHHAVSRSLRGEEIVMSRVYVCRDL